eukprot:1194426-Prorocentrum_minimum.AAC.3
MRPLLAPIVASPAAPQWILRQPHRGPSCARVAFSTTFCHSPLPLVILRYFGAFAAKRLVVPHYFWSLLPATFCRSTCIRLVNGIRYFWSFFCYFWSFSASGPNAQIDRPGGPDGEIPRLPLLSGSQAQVCGAGGGGGGGPQQGGAHDAAPVRDSSYLFAFATRQLESGEARVVKMEASAEAVAAKLRAQEEELTAALAHPAQSLAHAEADEQLSRQVSAPPAHY